MKNISHTAFLLQQHSFKLKYRSRILTVPPKQKSSLHLPLHPLHTSKSHFFFREKINPTFSRKIYPIPFTFHCHSNPHFQLNSHLPKKREKLSLSTEIHTFNFPFLQRSIQSQFSRTCRGFVMGFISIGLGIWSLFSMPPPRTRVGTLHSIRYVIIVQVLCFWA